jgi:hypothetical protein
MRYNSMGVLKVGLDEPMMAASSPRSVLDAPYDDEESRGRDKRRLLFEPLVSMNLRDRLVCDKTVAWLAKDSSSQLEELWLGPVFESSQTVLSAISTLPTSVTHLDLDLRNDLHLLPKAMPILCSKTQLKTLSLRFFGDSGAIELAKWIHKNPNLKQLDLRGNRIGSVGARAIASALIDCGHELTYLNLSCNCILDGDMISQLLDFTNLETLDLSFNWIGNDEVQSICQGLRKNKSLRELNLFGCQRISDVGLKSLLECLKSHNTTLRNINVQTYDYRANLLKDQIITWLMRNRSGRYLLKHDDVPPGLWPLVFPKINSQPDALYYFLREGGPCTWTGTG